MASKKKKKQRPRQNKGCFLAMHNGKLWCEFHLTYHEHSIDWGKHAIGCCGLPNEFSRSTFEQIPLRSLDYNAYKCKCGMLLLELLD